MIILQTGVPGSGKTLRVISDLAKKTAKGGEWEGRKIFVDGVSELTIPTESIPDGHSIQDMNVWLQWPENQGALVIIDEAQRIFPASGSAAKSELADWLHVHRHAGVDIILITQMPGRISKQVRDLVGAHYHIHKNPLGMRMLYYWDYCCNNVLSGMKDAKPALYKLDKNAFGLYKSAEIHTKVETPKTRIRWILPIALIFLIGSIAVSYSKLKDFSSDGGGVGVGAAVEQKTKDGVGNVSDNVAKDVGKKFKQTESLTEEMFKPKIPDKVESKPLYDGVRQVKTFEYPKACINFGDSCNCYTDQATKVAEIDKKTCLKYVKDGLPFNPYKDVQQAQNNQPPADYKQGGQQDNQVAVMGGQSPKNLMYDGYVEAGRQFSSQGGVVLGSSQ